METEKEEEKNEVNEHVSEEDICPPELDKTSTSNQKDLDDEVSKDSKKDTKISD